MAGKETNHNIREITEKFDVIFSNPPYIPTNDIAHLMPNACLYEPITALDGGRNNTGFIIASGVIKCWRYRATSRKQENKPPKVITPITATPNIVKSFKMEDN
ncbi:hypothetical protein [Entomobacter blattae]|uniref:hypothetical protein n=1 Tax=Entomobacter blattae TaxID=2762277 RepID=UPI00193BED84